MTLVCRPPVTIDREYPGREQALRSMFYEMWSRLRTEFPAVDIREIGRRSRAHHVAYLTMRGKRKAARVLTDTALRRLALP